MDLQFQATLTHVKCYKYEKGLKHLQILLDDDDWKEVNKEEVWISLKKDKKNTNKHMEYILNSEYVHDFLQERTIKLCRTTNNTFLPLHKHTLLFLEKTM